MTVIDWIGFLAYFAFLLLVADGRFSRVVRYRLQSWRPNGGRASRNDK